MTGGTTVRTSAVDAVHNPRTDLVSYDRCHRARYHCVFTIPGDLLGLMCFQFRGHNELK